VLQRVKRASLGHFIIIIIISSTKQSQLMASAAGQWLFIYALR